MDSLTFEETTRRQPGPGEIEVEVHAALNYMFFQRIQVLFALSIASIMIVYGFIKARQDPVIEEINVEISKLGRQTKQEIRKVHRAELNGSTPLYKTLDKDHSRDHPEG